MRVGLVRHFPVNEPMPSGWMTALQLHEWRQRYELAETQILDIAFDQDGWQRCYSSDSQRAFLTAKAMYAEEIVATPLLREPDIQMFRTGRLKLPYGMWRWTLRMAWLSGHRSQRAARHEFRQRVKAVADLIESEDSDILLFSHAGMMAYLRRELLRRSFVGPKYEIPEHGKLYVFRR